MKKLVILIGLVALFAACQEDSGFAEQSELLHAEKVASVSETEITTSHSINNFMNPVNTKESDQKKYIFYAAWDPGWKTPGCNKFGICEPVSCWFCCVENGVIVPCDSDNGMISFNTGVVTIDPVTERGNLIFYLNPIHPKHEQAIAERDICKVAKDFDMGEYKILEGEYEYDESIGEYGGYIIQTALN